MEFLGKRNFFEGLCFGVVSSLIVSWSVKKYLDERKDSYEPPPTTKEVKEPQSIEEEQLVRTKQFFGDAGLEKLKSSVVVIVGLGGVGSHCAVSLARSGVGSLKLIDFDQVTLSSLNRHGCATREDVGLSKVEVLKSYIERISPHIVVEAEAVCFSDANAKTLLRFQDKKPHFVIDCIDNIPTKVELIAFCYQEKIPCVSSGGCGGKADPTRIRIDDLFNTIEDPLCASLRTLLRKKHIRSNCMICYSTEKGCKKLLPLQSFHVGNVDAYRVFSNFRVRVIPVIAPLPAIFGQSLASYVLCQLAHQPILGLTEGVREASAEERLSRRNYKQLFDAVKQLFNSSGAHTTKSYGMKSLEFKYKKTRWLYVDVYKGTCVITRKQLKPRALQLVPWRCIDNDLRESLHTDRNVICLDRNLTRRHLSTFLSTHDGQDSPRNLEDVWDAETIARIDAMLSQQELPSEQDLVTNSSLSTVFD